MMNSVHEVLIIPNRMEWKYALAMMNFVYNSFTNVDGCSVVSTMTNSVHDPWLNHKRHGWNPSKWIGTWPQAQNDDLISCNSFLARSRDFWMNISLLWMDCWTGNDELRLRLSLKTYGWHPPQAIGDSVHEPFAESQESWMKYCKIELDYVRNSKRWMRSWDFMW